MISGVGTVSVVSRSDDKEEVDVGEVSTGWV